MTPPDFTRAYDPRPALPGVQPPRPPVLDDVDVLPRTWHRSSLRLVVDVGVMLGAMSVAALVRGEAVTGWTAIFAAVAVLTMASRGAYARRLEHSVSVLLIRHVLASTLVALLVTTTLRAFVDGEPASPRDAVAYYAVGTLALIAVRSWRELRDRQAFRQGRGVARAVVLGEGGKAALIARRLRERPDLGIQLVGHVGERPTTAPLHGVSAPGSPPLPVLGTYEDLSGLVERHDVDVVLVAFFPTERSDARLSAAVAGALDRRVKVFAVPRLFDVVNTRAVRHRLGTLAVDELRAVDPRSRAFQAKYAIDRVVGSIAVLVLAPLLLTLAVLVRLSSPGPVLYKQRRVGLDGQEFDILKFRSMRVAPAPPVGWIPAAGAAPGGVEGEDRRTPIGRFLRRTNLDELPQLLNIAKGDMCIVGPRPERPEYVALFSRDLRSYNARHRVKAGLTGWAQVNGLRGQTSIADRTDWDNYYIENWSFALDLAIVVRTFRTFFEDNE